MPSPRPHRTHEDDLVEIAIALKREEAQEAQSVTYSPRCTILATLPHSDPGNIPLFLRRNGGYTLFLQAGYRVKNGQAVYLGYPYGVLPRLLLAWITAEAVRTRSQKIKLGENLSEFLHELELGRGGGPRGDITRLKDQMQRLFAARIAVSYEDKTGGQESEYIQLAQRAQFFWDPVSPADEQLTHATIVLGDAFYRELRQHPVPLDLRVVKGLRRSSMALDIYAWLTYRMSFLKQETLIPWASLKLQFGADYTRARAFKAKFLEHLADVTLLYSHAHVAIEEEGLRLYPSRPQVLPKKKAPAKKAEDAPEKSE